MGNYATVAQLCYELDLDSTDARRAAALERMIGAAEALIDEYVGASLTQDDRQMDFYGLDSPCIFIAGVNVDRVLWVGVEQEDMITLTAAAQTDRVVFEKREDAFGVSVNDSWARTTFTATETVGDVVDWINAAGLGVTAALVNSLHEDYPAWCFYDTYQANDYQLYVTGAAQRIECQRVTDDMLRANQCISEGVPARIIFRSGYDTIPAAVVQATLLLASAVYRVSESDGTKKSERIGDYSYALNSSDVQIDVARKAAFALLGAYRRITI